MDISAESLALHYKLKGKLEVISRYPIQTQKDLSLAYTPGVAAALPGDPKRPRQVLPAHPAAERGRRHHRRLRRAGPGQHRPRGRDARHGGQVRPLQGIWQASMPSPCAWTPRTWTRWSRPSPCISKSFGGINLEDISAPRCFEVERRLKEVCDIPVFHDDQHGTAVVITGRPDQRSESGRQEEGGREDRLQRHRGRGRSPSAKLLLDQGFCNMILCDKDGILCEGDADLHPHHAALAARTNREHRHGTLADALVGADVFIGVSAPAW